ncbi:TetR family transcriptional regulator [Jeongeupia sp. HS-3]|uniref:TetR/AcrR family transcriptional regulator n=1 Tax=Jeongeupia sp. HS-3 TaxID=1009682 RepID=UPI0018A3E29F|nr:TetR/AcrR family transcriptional regulator [Jeongeupia sp. HS-3]BCL74491.1 TetR family transcriptional regulator [Jeongeupia sp. HS-3]
MMQADAPVPPRPRGRPRNFDRAQALDLALQLFWHQGYEGTSIADLTAAIGIPPASLYAAFHSKEALYREVLALYAEREGASTRRALDEAPSAYLSMRCVLVEAAQRFVSATPGCLITTAVLGCAPENRGAAAAATTMRNAVLVLFQQRFDRAVHTGELPPDTETAALARCYGAVLQGMSIQACDGASVAELTALADAALTLFPGRR